MPRIVGMELRARALNAYCVTNPQSKAELALKLGSESQTLPVDEKSPWMRLWHQADQTFPGWSHRKMSHAVHRTRPSAMQR